MKIRPDQIEGVQSDRLQRQSKTSDSDVAFGDLLDQEVARGDASSGTQEVAPPPIVNPLIAAGAVSAVESTDEGTVTSEVESILDKWDDYASDLADPEVGLKEAYNTLDEIAAQVADLKAGQPDLAESNPELGELVDDLETLTATEQFKFNRGDYV